MYVIHALFGDHDAADRPKPAPRAVRLIGDPILAQVRLASR